MSAPVVVPAFRHADGMSETGLVEAIGAAGRWQVTTETSTYVIDLDAQTCIRVPDAGLGSLHGLPPAQNAALRRDHEPVCLASVTAAVVGTPLILLLDVRGDGVLTLRRSTCVRQIRPLATVSG